METLILIYDYCKNRQKISRPVGSSLCLRNPQISDYPALSTFVKQAFSEMEEHYSDTQRADFVKEIMTGSHFLEDCSWVASVRGTEEVVGLVLVNRCNGFLPYIASISVASGWRRRGVGSMLLSKVLDSAYKYTTEGKYVLADVHQSNSASVKLFSNFGFI
jgi:ribosomal protein S18 acetylase RimI-like enzyme